MRLVYIVALSIVGLGCQRQLYTLADLPPTYLSYGQGGGFTGQEVVNYLLPNGQRFRYDQLSRDTSELSRLKSREAKQRFAQADSLFQQSELVRAPGNRYTFIRYHTPDTLYTATWGAMDYIPAANLLRLYRQLGTQSTLD